VVLTLTRRRGGGAPPHGRVRLFGARGPQGRFVERDGDDVICVFQPRSVLKWFWKQEPWDTREDDEVAGDGQQ
jgi:hypothetical protein